MKWEPRARWNETRREKRGALVFHTASRSFRMQRPFLLRYKDGTEAWPLSYRGLDLSTLWRASQPPRRRVRIEPGGASPHESFPDCVEGFAVVGLSNCTQRWICGKRYVTVDREVVEQRGAEIGDDYPGGVSKDRHLDAESNYSNKPVASLNFAFRSSLLQLGESVCGILGSETNKIKENP